MSNSPPPIAADTSSAVHSSHGSVNPAGLAPGDSLGPAVGDAPGLAGGELPGLAEGAPLGAATGDVLGLSAARAVGTELDSPNAPTATTTATKVAKITDARVMAPPRSSRSGGAHPQVHCTGSVTPGKVDKSGQAPHTTVAEEPCRASESGG